MSHTINIPAQIEHLYAKGGPALVVQSAELAHSLSMPVGVTAQVEAEEAARELAWEPGAATREARSIVTARLRNLLVVPSLAAEMSDDAEAADSIAQILAILDALDGRVSK